MKRYCVSQAGSNVIYVFSTPEEADEQVEVLGGKGRLWFVHRPPRFETLPTIDVMRAHGQESLCPLEI